ncbi:MAG: glycosyltransferase 87 family protein, partial [Pseudomonadota bacterium]
PWLAFGEEAAAVAGRINYPHLATIYPPVAQGAFLLAAWVEPFGLGALRLVLLGFELSGVGLLVLLLRAVGRAPVWVAIYWWNPLIAKELGNSAHMEAVLLPFLVGAVLLALRLRPVAAAGVLALAAGVKLWPALLLPMLLAGAGWRRAAAGAGLAAAIGAAVAAPVLLSGLDRTSGFVAYAAAWERNDALFGGVREAIAVALEGAGLHLLDPGRLARAGLMGLVALTALWLARGVARDGPGALPAGVLAVTALLFLVSPTGYPWYYAWLLPFLAVVPVRGLMLLTLTLPLYYLRFEMVGRGQEALFDDWIVWLEFGPVLGLLLWDALRGRRIRRMGAGVPA